MSSLGRPRAFDRQAALGAAMAVFWRKGFAATSMNDLCEAMGIRSPSLYAAFGGKEALYLEAVDHYVRHVGPPIWDRLADGATAREGVRALLAAAARSLPRSEAVPAGCMTTLGATGDEWPGPVADAVRQVRLECLNLLRARIGDALARGELAASADVEGLSRFYLGVFQGMAVQAKDGATTADLLSLAEAAMAAWPAG